MTEESGYYVPCEKCRGVLEPSGYEPCRHICKNCGQHYLMMFKFVAVNPPKHSLLLGEGTEVVDGSKTSE